MNKTLTQIIQNTLSRWLAVLAQVGIAFILVPFLMTRLGQEGYGLVGLLGVLLGFSQIADLGLRSALGRELTEQVARNDTNRFNELITTALVLYTVIALILASAGWILASWFTQVFKIPAELQADAVLLIRLYGTGAVLFSFITPVFNAALSSHQRFDLVNSIQTFCGIFSGVLLFTFLPMFPNALHGWAAIMLLNHLLMLLLALSQVSRVCKTASIHARFFYAKRLAPLFRLGGSIYALQLTQLLSAQSDPLVISYFFGPAGVALYQPGQRLSSIAQSVVLALGDQLYPLTTKQHVDQQIVKMQQLLILGTKYTLLLGTLACVGMIACAEPLCRLWLFDSLGEDYRIVSLVLMGWAAADFMAYAAGTQWSVLLGMKRLKFLIWTQLPTAVLNVLVSIYLVGFTRLGIPGVLVATILIGMIRRPLLIVHTARACGLKASNYLKQAYLRPGIFLVLLSGVAFMFRQIQPLQTWTSLIIFCIGVGGAGLVLIGLVGLDKKERALLWREGQGYVDSFRRRA